MVGKHENKKIVCSAVFLGATPFLSGTNYMFAVLVVDPNFL